MLLPSRITDTTATLIENIFMNNVDCQIASELLMVVSDHLPVYAFVKGIGGMREEEGAAWDRGGW